jgi:hypothetical protein
VRELELNDDMRSVNNLLDFMEKVGGHKGLRRGQAGRILLLGHRRSHKVTAQNQTPTPESPNPTARRQTQSATPTAKPNPNPKTQLNQPQPTRTPPPQKIFNGGSDFNEPVSRCLSRLTDAKWANSDILLVSGARTGAAGRALAPQPSVAPGVETVQRRVQCAAPAPHPPAPNPPNMNAPSAA